MMREMGSSLGGVRLVCSSNVVHPVNDSKGGEAEHISKRGL